MSDTSEKKSYSRRSVLDMAALGAGAALVGAGFTRPVFAQSCSEVDKAIAWAKANLPSSTPEIIRAAAKEGQLNLALQIFGGDVTNNAMIAKFNEHYPFIKVSYTMQSSQQIRAKLNAEQTSKQGFSDYVVLSSDVKTATDLLDAGYFTKFVVSQDGAYSDLSKRTGYWYAANRTPNFTVYRKGALSPEELQLIRTYKGLGDPRFKGRLGMLNLTASNALVGVYTLAKDSDPTLWTGLAANKPQIKVSGGPLIDGLLSGEYDIGVMCAIGNAVLAAKSGAPIECICSSPTPDLYGGLGTISSVAPHRNAAMLWADFVTSKEGQAVFLDVSGLMSARPDAPKSWVEQQPWFWQDVSQFRAVDWNQFAADQKALVERFQKDFQAG